MKERRVFFLVKANNQIGGGHLVRCINLATTLRNKEIQPQFLVVDTDQSYLDILKKNKLGYNQLHSDLTNHSKLIIKQLSPFPGSMLVVDTDDPIFHAPEFQKEILNSGFFLMIITIKPQARYHAHILLNQNPIALNHTYDVDNHTKKLLGPQYFILPVPFRTESQNIDFGKSTAIDLFTSFGTADAHNITLSVLKACERLPDHELINKIILVAGQQNKHLNMLREFIKNTHLNIEIHVNPLQIRKLMIDSDIAITSAGLTFWELISLKIPSLVIPASNREIETATYLHNNRLCYQISTYEQVSDIDNIKSEIEKSLSTGLGNWIDKDRFGKLINPHGIGAVVEEMLDTLKS